MEVIPGRARNSLVYVFQGYTYHRDRRAGGDVYRCSSRSSTHCPGASCIGYDGTVTVFAYHTHPPEQSVVEKAALKQQMLLMCRETQLSLREIFDTVCLRFVTIIQI